MTEIKRNITDVAFSFIYILFFLGLVGISIYAYINGDPRSLIEPVDSDGEKCGEGRNVNKTVVYYFDVAKCVNPLNIFLTVMARKSVCSTPKVCLEKCPTTFALASVSNFICRGDIVPKDGKNLAELMANDECSKHIIPSLKAFDYCFPDFKRLDLETISSAINLNEIKQHSKFLEYFIAFEVKQGELIRDIKIIRWWIVVYLLLPLVLSMLGVLFLGYGSYPIIIIFYIGCLLISLASTSFFTFWHLKPDHPLFNITTIQTVLKKVDENRYVSREKGKLGLAITSGIISLIILLCGCFLAGGLRQVCACAKYCTRLTVFSITAPIIPIFSWIFQMALILWLSSILLFLFTTSTKEYRFITWNDGVIGLGEPCALGTSDVAKDSCIFAGFYTKNLALIFAGIATFGAIWTIFLTQAIEIFIVAYIYANSYWTGVRTYFNTFFISLLKAYRYALFTNLGSLILGSLVITLIVAVRIVFEFFIRLSGTRENRVMESLAKFGRWLLAAFQSLMERITSAAYIQVAISGHSFCASSFEILAAFANFPAASVVLQMFVGIIKFVGIASVSILSGYLTYFHLQKYVKNIENPLIISTSFGCFSILLSMIIFNIYTTGLLTIHYCVCHDFKINDGTPQCPYMMTTEIQQAYGVKKKSFS